MTFRSTCLLLNCLWFFLPTSSYGQKESRKNAGKADMNVLERVEAAKDVVVAKIKIDRKTPKPEWGPRINDEMLAVLEKQKSYHQPEPYTVKPALARKLPDLSTALNDILKENKISPPDPKCDTSVLLIPGNGEKIRLKVYTPKETNGPFPVIMYYHGGGWVLGSPERYHTSAQAICEQTGCVVVSVAYRKAPEHTFPAAHHDAFTAYNWIRNNVDSVKGDLEKIAVAGESAGASLALGVCLMAREKNVPLPVHQLLIYPVASPATDTESYSKFADARPINKPLMKWFFSQYLKDTADYNHPYINLLKADLKKLPPVTFIAAELDPLFSEGEALAKRLNDSGVRIFYRKFNGVTHGFFGMGQVVPAAMVAEIFAAQEIKLAFRGIRVEK